MNLQCINATYKLWLNQLCKYFKSTKMYLLNKYLNLQFINATCKLWLNKLCKYLKPTTYLKNSSRKGKYKFLCKKNICILQSFYAGDLNLIFAVYMRKSWKRNLETFAWLSWPVEILPLPPSPTSKPQVVVFTNILLQSLDIFHELSMSH